MNATFLANMRDKTEATLKARWRRYRALVENSENLKPDEMEELAATIELLRLTPADLERDSRTLAEHKRQLNIMGEQSQREAAQAKAVAEFNAWQIEKARLEQEIKDKQHDLYEKMSDANQRHIELQKAPTWIGMAKTNHPLLFNEVSGN